jgi:hypothetical protein
VPLDDAAQHLHGRPGRQIREGTADDVVSHEGKPIERYCIDVAHDVAAIDAQVPDLEAAENQSKIHRWRRPFLRGRQLPSGRRAIATGAR